MFSTCRVILVFVLNNAINDIFNLLSFVANAKYQDGLGFEYKASFFFFLSVES